MGERAFLHDFEDGRGEHLWFVLSEPNEPPLAVCLALTSSHPQGETLLVIPAGRIVTDPNGRRSAYRTKNDSTIYIVAPLALTRSECATYFLPTQDCGSIKRPLLWDLRRAVRDGCDFIRDPDVREEVSRACTTWFDRDGNPILR